MSSPLAPTHSNAKSADIPSLLVLQARDGNIELSIFEDGVPPEFRLRFLDWQGPVDLAQLARDVCVRTIRFDGRTQVFSFAQQHQYDGYLRSTTDVPEPHSFTAEVQLRGEALQVEFADDADSCHHSSHSGHSSHSDGGQSTPNPLHRYSANYNLPCGLYSCCTQ
jgi:nickel/cobalt exporter